MSENHSQEISKEMYHRVYRLIKRKVNPHTIAATLHLPVRTILGVINRIERSDDHSDSTEMSVNSEKEQEQAKDFLDVYFYPKTRYAVLDLVGALSDSCIDQVTTELQKALSSSWKAVAIRMCDVTFISEAMCKIIIDHKEKFSVSGRFLAILDPAPEIEQSLIKYNLETTVPVFGTESAFEDAAYIKKGTTFMRRNSQNR